ncbi:membrane protein [Gordonia phage Clawz]|uniref:Membrane protein n=1 Tax=Gordonia phage Clawz TaxID=2743910 RepID=A0AAE7K665_9CAUD|nr:membrane protein [Gordonia phage Clawz]QKY79940.1 membrane protein [Gordonia phage Clawz]
MNWMELLLGVLFLTPITGCLLIAYVLWCRWTWCKAAEPLHGDRLRRDRYVWIGYHLLPITVAGAVLVTEAFSA